MNSEPQMLVKSFDIDTALATAGDLGKVSLASCVELQRNFFVSEPAN